MNHSETIGFTVYTMDEVVDDCFIVERDSLQNGISVFRWNGYGHCNGEEGGMEILLENMPFKIPIEFHLSADGARTLMLYPPGKNSEVYLEKNE